LYFLHDYYRYFLAVQQTAMANLSGLVILVVLYRLVLYNPRLAWASRGAMPSWVAKRVKPLTKEQVRKLVGSVQQSHHALLGGQASQTPHQGTGQEISCLVPTDDIPSCLLGCLENQTPH
jgi:hypothetical protein